MDNYSVIEPSNKTIEYRSLEHTPIDSAALRRKVATTQEQNRSSDEKTMTMEERIIANRIADNAVVWAKDFLGIELSLPLNARVANVRNNRYTDFLIGHFDTDRAIIEYNREEDNGICTFAKGFGHEFCHMISRVVNVTGATREATATIGLTTRKNKIYDGSGIISLRESTVGARGSMAGEALNELMNIHQLNYLAESNPQEEYLEGVNQSYTYEIIFLDTVLEQACTRLGRPYAEVQKQLFSGLIKGKTGIQRILIDAFGRPFAQELMKRTCLNEFGVIGKDRDFNQAVCIYNDGLEGSKQGGIDRRTAEHYEDYMRNSLELLEQVGLKDNVVEKMNAYLKNEQITVLGGVTYKPKSVSNGRELRLY
jgi:hypothetical protein